MTSIDKILLAVGVIGITAASGCPNTQKREESRVLGGIVYEIRVPNNRYYVSVGIKMPTRDGTVVSPLDDDTLKIWIDMPVSRSASESYPMAVGDEVYFRLNKGFEGKDIPYKVNPSDVQGEIVSWRKRK